MTFSIACWIVLAAAAITGITIWIIHTAEQRLRHAMREALNRPIFEYREHQTRYRNLDDEYRALVLQEYDRD